MTLIKKFAWYGSSVAFAAVLALALLVTGPARTAEAAVTATAGTLTVGVSTNGATGTGVYTALAVAPTIPEGLATDIAIGTVTATLAAPTGWDFNTAATLTVTGGGADITAKTAAVTNANLITVTITAGATATVDTLTITGITVRPETAVIAIGAASGVWADGTGTAIVGLAGDTGITLTSTLDTGNYVTAGSGIGATSTANANGGTILTVSAQGAGLTSATFQTNSGTFTANGAASLFCGDGVTTCDVTGAANDVVQVQLSLPAAGGSVVITVTPAGVGTVSNITVTTTVAPVLTSINVGTTAVAVDAAGTLTGDISFQLQDQNGAAFTTSGTVTVSTNLGVIDSGDFTTCSANDGTPTPASSDASCTITNTGATHVVEIFGNGVSGTATVTITATIGGATATSTKSVTITGVTSTVGITFQVNHTSAGTWVAGATPQAAATGASFRASIDLRDAGGNRVVGQNATLTFSPAGCATSDGVGDANVTATANATRGIDPALAAGTTCTVTATSNLKTASATFTVGSALATTSVVTVTAPDIATVTTGSITVEVKGSTGILAGDNQAVTLVVTSGALVDSTVETINGVATFTYVSPGTAQTVNATAVLANGVSASDTFSVGGAVTPPPAGGEGTFAAPPSFGTGNVGSAVFQGGTIEQLVAAVIDAGGTSVWVQDSNGIWRSYNTLATGSAAFVNNGFNTAFAAGFGVQAVFVVR